MTSTQTSEPRSWGASTYRNLVVTGGLVVGIIAIALMESGENRIFYKVPVTTHRKMEIERPQQFQQELNTSRFE